MRKIKEVLRLRFELGLGQREIARACSISQGAVHSYLKKAAVAGVCWPLPEGWDEPRVEQALSTSVIRIALGSAAPTKTRTGCCDSTSLKEPTCPAIRKQSSTR
jgi:Sigma-70, region 4